jgi:hypothetical protein
MYSNCGKTCYNSGKEWDFDGKYSAMGHIERIARFTTLVWQTFMHPTFLEIGVSCGWR